MNVTAIRLNQSQLPDHAILNEKQREVLEKLVNGVPYKSIAYDLKISMPSVRQYAHRLYKKLNVANRADAMIRYGSIG
jgi:DNA-binding NarL/FixJ family response regulator